MIAQALDDYATAPSPPPSPVADTASSVGDDGQQDGERPPPTVEDQWAAFTAAYNIGDVINGRVRSITKFGAFVQTAVGLDGLGRV